MVRRVQKDPRLGSAWPVFQDQQGLERLGSPGLHRGQPETQDRLESQGGQEQRDRKEGRETQDPRG